PGRCRAHRTPPRRAAVARHQIDVGPSSPSNPTRMAGPRLASSLLSPSTRSPIAAAAASSAISLRPDCPSAKTCKTSSTRRCRWSARRRSWRSPRAIKGANLLLFGPPGVGKSHLAAAIGLALVENGWRVLFMRTSDLVQRLQIARRELALENALAKLDKYHLLILDDIVYVSKDQAETSVLFELIGSRYERRSMLITAIQQLGEGGKVFPDQAMTLAAIDRLVHHSTIFEMNVESYRRRAALDRKRGSGRPPTHATIKEKG